MTSLADLVAVSQGVAATRARLGKVRQMAALLKALSPDEIETAVHYLSGEIPQGKIGIGYSAVRAAASQAAADAPALSVSAVDQVMAAIAAMSGKGSAARRATALRELFQRATSAEQSFLLRLLVGELRQGALAGVMIEAIAAAAELPVAQVRRAVMYAPSLGEVAGLALRAGGAGLERFQLEIFSPVAPMLAQTAADVGEALEALAGEVAFEWKMDGARVQVHKRDHEVRVYTRGLNEVTAAVPEIVETVRALPERCLVLDGEAIAIEAGRPCPFQVTMRRFGRRLNVETQRAELPIHVFFFDCLRFGEQSLAECPARERSRFLEQAVPLPLRIPRLVTSSEPAARAFYEAALAAGHEGVMAKSLESVYEAGNRGASWIKIKRVHTLDLLVLAAEWGYGRRTGKLSNLHLGAREPATGKLVMLGKTFKGLTDALLEWQTAEFLAREIRRDRSTVFIRPEIVVEIAFSDLQASTRYPGGFALRLARVKRYRDDKRAEHADTMDEIRRIYAAQSGTPAPPAIT